MTFKEYVLDWFRSLVEEHYTDKEWQRELFEQLNYDDTYLDEGESVYDFLLAMDDANELYSAIFGQSSYVTVDDLPDAESFMIRMYKDVCSDIIKEYDFAEELLEDMAISSVGYAEPEGFFKDLQTGGCASGLVGMFIYHDSCKQFYIKHIDDMEAYIEEFENNMGDSIRNEQKLPHYTFICWLCYEELGYQCATILWPELF